MILLMPRMAVKASHFVLDLAWNTFFRTSYSPRRLRRNFEFLNGKTQRQIQKKYPRVQFKNFDLDGMPVEEIVTTQNPERTILYFHGGGYIMGTISTYRLIAVMISYKFRARVILPEYRLAPEAPYPAALEDAEKIYDYAQKAYPNSTFIVGGDSAGGGMTLSLLISLVEKAKPLPVKAFCLSPWTDHSGSGASWDQNEKVDFWLSHKHRKAWSPLYRGTLPENHPRISPLFGDPKGLCPLMILVGDQEVLLDDSLVFVKKAQQVGVSVGLHVGKDMQHDWPIALPFLKESKEAWKSLSEFINRTTE